MLLELGITSQCLSSYLLHNDVCEMICSRKDVKRSTQRAPMIKIVTFVMDQIRQDQCDQKKLLNFYKSCLKIISLEKLKILTPLQKLPKNTGDLGK